MLQKNRSMLAAAVVATLAVAPATVALAAAGDWHVGLKGVQIVPDESSEAVPGLLLNDGLDITNKLAPEFSVGRFVTDHIAIGGTFTPPREHEVIADTVGGLAALGSFKQMPINLLGQYHFRPEARLRPYVGAGVNYTRITGEKLGGLQLDGSSVGPVAQVGLDFGVTEKFAIALDAKKAWVDSDVETSAGARVTSVDVDPWVFGLGFTYKLGGAPAPVAAPAPAPAPPPPPPPADSDGDGVIDANDRCPGTPAGAKVDAVGCELDSDGDGVVDSKDQCPGTPAGRKVDAVGCETEITLQGVTFETNSAVLTAQDKLLLDSAAQAILSRPAYSVEVRGHTDDRGSNAYNQKLSERRAASVREYLISKGIPEGRFSGVKGFGEEQPIASNDTDEGRAQNRRVTLQFTRTE